MADSENGRLTASSTTTKCCLLRVGGESNRITFATTLVLAPVINTQHACTHTRVENLSNTAV